MDVAFFYGHNHKYDTGNDYYYAKGDKLPVATADKWGWDYDINTGYLPSMDLSSESKTLNFTHMCAGYLEPTSTGSYDNNTTRLGTAVAVTMYEDSIKYTTYDASGVYTGKYAVNETVTRAHAASAQPEQPEQTVTHEQTGIVVTAPGITSVTASLIENEPVPEGYAVSLTYDISPVEYIQGTTATVTVPVTSDFDASKSVYVLHAGSVIGADGFGFDPTEDGYKKIAQIGIAVLEDDVEIGANTCVDRAVMGETIIHKGVKLDNLVQIGHNCEVNSHTVMSAQVGVAGSTKIGEWCMFGGQVGIAGHANIADRTMVGAQSGIPNSVKKPNQELMGTPAIDPRVWWKAQAVVKQLPDMWTSMNRMKKEIEELKARLKELGGDAQ
jgi:carbonic anhydrase/acetyltransferase-like protein (isoleucine patch superfamily)